MSDGRAARSLPWYAFALLPPLGLLALLWRDVIDIPFQDQWEFVPTIDAMFAGRLRLTELWAQHNEHRLVFPKLVMLALARLSGWNIAWETAASFVFAGGSFLLLARTARRVAADVAGPVIALLSLLVFSPAQWENWLWGWQLQIFMNVLAVIGCVWLLLTGPRSWWRLAAAVALGLVAAYSFANGIAVWIVGGMLLSIRRDDGGIARRHALSAWCTAALLTTASYLYGYQSVPWHPAPFSGLKHPVGFVLHVLHYLGSPLGGLHPTSSAIAGLLGIAAGVSLVWWCAVRRDVPRDLWLLAAAPGVYAMGCASITAIGRAGMGAEQALASKYVTLATPLWCSIVLLCGLLVSRSTRRSAVGARLAATLFVVIAVGAIGSAIGGMQAAERRAALLRPYPELLRELDRLDPRERAVLASIHPTPDELEAHAGVLREHRLSVFRGEAGEGR